MAQVAALERNCDEIIVKNISQATDVCGKIMDYISGVSGGVFEYDARIFNYDFTEDDLLNEFLNNCGKAQELYTSIHII